MNEFTDQFTGEWLNWRLDQANQLLSSGDYDKAGLAAKGILFGCTNDFDQLVERLTKNTVLWYIAHFNMLLARIYAYENDSHHLSLHCYDALNAMKAASVYDAYPEACAHYYLGIVYSSMPERHDHLVQACSIFDLIEQGDEKTEKGRHLAHLALANSQVLRATPHPQFNRHELEDNLLAAYTYGVVHRLPRMAILATFVLMDVYNQLGDKKSYNTARRRRLQVFFTWKIPSVKLAWLAFRLWINRPPEPLFNPKEDAI